MKIKIPIGININLERLLIAALMVGLFLPISLNLGVFKINPWHLPFFVLLFIEFIKVIAGHRSLQIDLWDICMVSMVHLLLIGTLLSDYMEESFSMLISLSFTIILAIYVRKRPDLFNYKTVLILLLSILLIQGIIGIIQQVTFSSFGSPKAFFGEESRDTLSGRYAEFSLSRVIGTLGHPNFVGMWVIISFPFIWKWMMDSKRALIKNLLFVALVIGFITIAITLSRAILGLFLILLGGVLLSKLLLKMKVNFNPSLKTVLILVTLLFGGVFFIFKYFEFVKLFFAVLEYRVAETFIESGTRSSTSFRLTMNEGAIKAFVLNPFFGVGYGNMNLMWEELGYPGLALYGMRVHNIFFTMLSEGGIFVFVLFILILFAPVYLILTSNIKRKLWPYIWFLIVVFTLGQVYISPLSFENSPLIFLMLAFSLNQIEQEIKAHKR